HSLEPGENLTGPSLAHVWGRKAGTLPDFHRYSEALQRSGVVWNEQSLSWNYTTWLNIAFLVLAAIERCARSP
ncbi:MAG TPA: hypothetical protein VFA81_12380, partial [Burkholderiales bacterium]|nr:hypothetical protein [Burkholderiales bacterium]